MRVSIEGRSLIWGKSLHVYSTVTEDHFVGIITEDNIELIETPFNKAMLRGNYFL